VHHRLADCGARQCGAMSEGWGDFLALHTIARDGDNLNGTFGLATYSTSAFDPNSAPVMNGGPVEMRNVTVSVSITSPTSGVSFKHDSSDRISRIAPFSSVEAAIEIEVDRNFTGIGQLQLSVRVSNDAACEASVSRQFSARINVDDVPNVSTVDTVESPSSPWTATGADADQIWARVELAPFNNVWFGRDFGAASDTSLESPDLRVGTTAPLVIAFDHAFGFEVDGTTFFDGGVIEISRNGGPFEDISAIVDPGYGGTLFIGSDNPLGGRRAFVGRSAGFPALGRLTLNLGTAFAGQTVRIRFRIATDAAAADTGWAIDNVSVQGITNLPFSALVEDRAKCRGVPKKR